MGMKDSGIEWIGEIPEEWKVKKIKYVSNLYTGNSISDDEKGYYEDSEYAFPYIATKDVSAEDSSIDYENGMYTKQNDHSFRIAPENSTLMCIEGGSAGKKIAKTNQKVSFVNKLCCFNAKKINANYLYMYLKSEAFKEEFNQHISGLIGGVSQTELKSFYILLPMEEEQKLIADFLEDKVGKIDDILADLNKQLDILEKYKKSLITEIVTNGLDPNIEKKDSGIDWIGAIPKKWKITKLKYHSVRIGDGIHGTPDYSEDGEYTFVNGGNFKGDKIVFFGNEGNISEHEFKRWYACVLNENTVMIALNGVNFGEVSYYNREKILLGKSAGYITLNQDYLPRYVGYYMQGYSARTIMYLSLNSTTIPNLSLSTLNNFDIPIMSVEEQIEIIDFLDKKCAQIDELIKDKKTQIEKMEGYKKSLIYEYVTGKKRVKGVE